MIKTMQKRRIIKAFGRQYSPGVIKVLTKAKILNANGMPYSSESIRQFVNGLRENEKVERKINAEATKILTRKTTRKAA